MKQWRVIIGMAILLFSLGGLATWDEWQTKRDQEVEKNKNKITQIKEQDVTGLEITNHPVSQNKSTAVAASDGSASDGSASEETPVDLPPKMALEKPAHEWQIAEPIKVESDQNSVGMLLRSVLDYAYTEQVAEGEGEWEKFGLKDPERVITLKVKDPSGASKVWSLYLGQKAPVGYSTYFRTSDSAKVFMGSQHLALATSKSLFDLRDKSVQPIVVETLQSIKYLLKNELVVEMRKEGEALSFVQPTGWELDQQDIKDYMRSIGELKAVSFADVLSAEHSASFAHPAFEIRWVEGIKAERTLKFAEFQNKFWVLVGTVAKEIPEKDYKRLMRSSEDFRSKRIFGNQSLDIVQVEIDGDRYQRRGALWYKGADADRFDTDGKLKSGEKSEGPKDVSHIGTFAVDLEFLKTDRFLSAAEPSVAAFLAKPPLHSIQIGFAESSKRPSVKMSLYEAAEKDFYLVKVSSTDMIYRIKRSAVANIKPEQQSPSAPSSPEGLNMEGEGLNDSLDPESLENGLGGGAEQGGIGELNQIPVEKKS